MSDVKFAALRTSADPVRTVTVSVMPRGNPRGADAQTPSVRQPQVGVGSAKPDPRPGTAIRSYEHLVDQMNQMARLLNKRYEFQVDESTEQLVVRVVDSETGELIRQIPPEEILKLASRMQEMIGVFLNEVA